MTLTAPAMKTPVRLSHVHQPKQKGLETTRLHLNLLLMYTFPVVLKLHSPFAIIIKFEGAIDRAADEKEKDWVQQYILRQCEETHIEQDEGSRNRSCCRRARHLPHCQVRKRH